MSGFSFSRYVISCALILLPLAACSEAECPGPDCRCPDAGVAPDAAGCPTVDVVGCDASELVAVPDAPDVLAETGDDASGADGTSGDAEADIEEVQPPLITVLTQYEGTQRVEELYVMLFHQVDGGSPPRDIDGVDISCETLVTLLNSGLRPPPPQALFSSPAMTLGEPYALTREAASASLPGVRYFKFTALAFGLESEGDVVVAGCGGGYGSSADLLTPGETTDIVLTLEDVLPPPPVALCPPGSAPGHLGLCHEVAGTLAYDDCDFLTACSAEGREVFEDTDCSGEPSPGPELVFHIQGGFFETLDIAISSETEWPSAAMPRVSVLRGSPRKENCLSSWTLEADTEGASRTASAIVHWRPSSSLEEYFIVVSFPHTPAAVSLCRRHPHDGLVCLASWTLDCPLSRPEHCVSGTLWNPIERGCWPCGEAGCDAYGPDTRTCGGSALACEGGTRCTQSGCLGRDSPDAVFCYDYASWLSTADAYKYDPWGRRVEQLSRGYDDWYSSRTTWEYDDVGMRVGACGGSIDYSSREVYDWHCVRWSYERDDLGVVTRMERTPEGASEPSEVWTYDWGDGSRPSTVTRDGGSGGDAPDGVVDAVWTLHWNAEGLLSLLETDGGLHRGSGMGSSHPGDLHLSYMSAGHSFDWGPYEGFRLPPFAPVRPDFGPPDGEPDMLWTFTYEDGRLLQTDIDVEPPYEFDFEDTRHLQWSTDDAGRPTGVRAGGVYSCGYSTSSGPAKDILKSQCPSP